MSVMELKRLCAGNPDHLSGVGLPPLSRHVNPAWIYRVRSILRVTRILRLMRLVRLYQRYKVPLGLQQELNSRLLLRIRCNVLCRMLVAGSQTHACPDTCQLAGVQGQQSH